MTIFILEGREQKQCDYTFFGAFETPTAAIEEGVNYLVWRNKVEQKDVQILHNVLYTTLTVGDQPLMRIFEVELISTVDRNYYS